MKRIALATVVAVLGIPTAAMLSGCQGILPGVYDEPDPESVITNAGQLYIDASDWGEWHYIDFSTLEKQLKADPDLNTSSLWITYPIPVPDYEPEKSTPLPEQSGIYTYWYDVFGEGISNNEFRSFSPITKQPEPERWTIAVHRNNVRTNGCGVYETSYTSIESCPADFRWLENLEYHTDEWNQTDVWAVQDRMLLGIIGNQGIYVNNTLGGWLSMDIPPMPPSFSLNPHVFILKLNDGSFAALQLADYIGVDGTKCCLTINYRYPL